MEIVNQKKEEGTFEVHTDPTRVIDNLEEQKIIDKLSGTPHHFKGLEVLKMEPGITTFRYEIQKPN